MKRRIFLTFTMLCLVQTVFAGGWGVLAPGPRESAATPVFSVRPIHPLPDWEGPEDLQPRGHSRQEDSPGSRLKISFPVGMLAMLLFFLMWKFLQSQE
jgi:hypothetical protein